MRKRGLRGGGTLRRKSPQQGQRPSSAMGPVASGRSQWPRRSHDGLMHCTVKPGRYCMQTPSVASQRLWRTGWVCAAEAPLGGPDRLVGEDSAVSRLWCQGKRVQGIVVGLRSQKVGSSGDSIVLELARSDDISGNEKSGGEGYVDEGIGNCVRAAGGAGEIEAGSVIHGTDVPEGGEESFERLACAAEDAEKEGERREEERARKPRKEA